LDEVVGGEASIYREKVAVHRQSKRSGKFAEERALDRRWCVATL